MLQEIGMVFHQAQELSYAFAADSCTPSEITLIWNCPACNQLPYSQYLCSENAAGDTVFISTFAFMELLGLTSFKELRLLYSEYRI
jgi:hypothetical protein